MINTSFIALTLVMAVLLVSGISSAALKTMTKKDATRLTLKVLVSILAWLTYVAVVSVSGILQTASLPPKIPLLLVFPLFTFIAIVVRTNTFRKLLAATPGHYLIYPQVFRVAVELLLLALFRKGLVPEAATFEGYNFEIVVATTALATGYIALNKKTSQYHYIRLWNICGLTTLTIVVFIFMSTAYFPSIYNHPEKLDIVAFGTFPNTLLAGFLMPLAVFLHIASLMKQKTGNQG